MLQFVLDRADLIYLKCFKKAYAGIFNPDINSFFFFNFIFIFGCVGSLLLCVGFL